ncbi:DNA-directed RNA polymerase subunit beta [Oceanobacillus massiliensis]|uniref:DNA-directed RNA polymerase subunit beta n=1 Tax=Oceanobacillus massiliensis TaxID=1465765 RepID=UPI00028884B3|nr:DNA-directed RNA polymerase subunit beta [Oceanobacillus massiliensis]
MATNQSEKQSRRALKEEKDAAASMSSNKAEAEKKDKQTRKQQKTKQNEEKRKNKIPRLRIFPIWLRIIIVLIIAAAALVAGLMIGYGVIGDGVPTDALKKETWQHIIDIVTKVE